MAPRKRNASQHSQQQQEDVHRGPRNRRARAREEQQNVIGEEQQNAVVIDNSQPDKQKPVIFKSGMYLDADILTDAGRDTTNLGSDPGDKGPPPPLPVQEEAMDEETQK
ncbi:hypothetical protein LIER_20945 [Lithospermum erythrorhizon]|uniref:Uncharacterized protein n=1 Tax=Lithospermum erythrorhizon TaxID=34254 RepID=A0AAV3QPU1_LITER